MTYYYCRFLSYMVVVLTNTRPKALDRLIEYVRVTKGNVGYSEEEIKEKARIDTIEIIDDVGYLRDLQNVSGRIAALKKEFNDKAREFESRLNDELRQVEVTRKRLAEIVRAVTGEDDEYREDDWIDER